MSIVDLEKYLEEETRHKSRPQIQNFMKHEKEGRREERKKKEERKKERKKEKKRAREAYRKREREI